MIEFIIVSDVHYNKKRKPKIDKLNAVLEQLSGYVFVDLGDVLTNPKELYDSKAYIYIPGNHDFNKMGVNFNNRRLHTEYFEFQIDDSLEKLIKENGFGTNLGEACETNYRICKINYNRATIYFTHLRPTKKVIDKLIQNAENKAVYIIYGHIHKRDGKIKKYTKYSKAITEIRIPTFKETNSFYLFKVYSENYKIKKFFIK